MKWGFIEGKDAKVSRKRFKLAMYTLIAAYLIIGFASLAKYTYIGVTHDFADGERYKSKTIIMEKH